jgi:hypothetical protein
MSAREWLLSILIAAHIVAVTLAAIPRPVSGPMQTVERPDGDPVAAALGPPLTALAQGLNRVQRTVYRTPATVRRYARAYTASVLPQNWSMFSDVLRVQRYLRLDYRVQVPGETPAVYQQLVLPSQVEGEPRLIYRSADKAVRVVMGAYMARLRDEEEGSLTIEDERPNTARLRPLLQHFTNRFAQQRGISREHIARVEIWAGSVPTPPPGEQPLFPAALRRDVLARYRTLKPQPAPSVPQALWTMQQQGDLSWQLVHAEERQ